MNNTNKNLICRWYEKSKKEDNHIFDRFIALWISFNAYYAADNLEKSENEQLKIFQNSINKKFFQSTVQENTQEFKEFKNHIDTKVQNAGFIQDLRYEVKEDRNKKRYENVESFSDYIQCVYQIRCNLFHGGKDVADAQDETLVRLALPTLSVFLKKIFESENIFPNNTCTSASCEH